MSTIFQDVLNNNQEELTKAFLEKKEKKIKIKQGKSFICYYG